MKNCATLTAFSTH